MEGIQGRITGHFGPSPFTSGAAVDWPGFCFPMLSQVIDAVCRRYDISRVDMVAERRDRKVLMPRFVAMYLCRKLTPASFPKIGRAFGNRDHSTCMNAYARVEAQMATDPDFKAEVEALAASLGGRV